MAEDLIETITKKFMDYTDAPEVFIRGAAYYIISATLGSYFRNSFVPLGCQRPNVWIVLSSIPARTRRSTVQRLSYSIFKDVVGGEQANNMTIEDGTPEGIMDAICEFESESYTIQSTEFGSILSKMRRREYSIGISSLLSKLYYGEGGKQNLSTRGGKEGLRVLPENRYVTMLTGLQEPQLYFTPEMLHQGLLRRLLVIYVDSADRWKPPIDSLRERFNCEDIVNSLRLKREGFEKFEKKIPVILVDEAEEKINAFSKELDATLDEKRDDLSIYRQSLWEHELKLATLHAIASSDPVAGSLLVSVDDVERAEKFLELNYFGMERVIESLGMEDEIVRTSTSMLRKIYRRIEEAGPDGLALDELGKRFSGLKRRQLGEYLETLVVQNKIYYENITTGKPGRPKQILKAVR